MVAWRSASGAPWRIQREHSAATPCRERRGPAPWRTQAPSPQISPKPCRGPCGSCRGASRTQCSAQ
eukprot:2087871-Pyramimonas_sp.AAC.1